jgi:adenosine kinase
MSVWKYFVLFCICMAFNKNIVLKKLIGFGSPIVDGVFMYDSNPEISKLMKERFKYHMSGGAENFPFDFYFEIMNSTKPHLLGGSAMNTIRGVNYLLNLHGDQINSVGFMGSIGNDTFGQFIKEGLKKEGIHYLFEEQENQRTATVIVVIEKKERIFYSDLGCSGDVTLNHFYNHKNHIGESDIFYADAYLIGRRFECFKFIYESFFDHKHITLVLNLASHLVIYDYFENFVHIIPFIDVVIVNKEELNMIKKKFIEKEGNTEVKNFSNEKFISFFSNKLGKKNKNKKRVIVNTRGKEDVIIFIQKWDDHGKSEEIFFRVSPLDNSKINIQDLNGAGDAFAAGFLTGIILEKSERESAELGNILAAEVMKLKGFQLPSDKLTAQHYKLEVHTELNRNDL